MNYDHTTVDCTFDSRCICRDCQHFYGRMDNVMRKHAPAATQSGHEHKMELVRRTDDWSIWRCDCGYLTEEAADAYLDPASDIAGLLELRDDLANGR